MKKNITLSVIAVLAAIFLIACTYRKTDLNPGNNTPTDSYYTATIQPIVTQNCSCHTTGQNPSLSSRSAIIAHAQAVYNSIQKPNGSMLAYSRISDENNKLLSDWINTIQ